MTDRAFRRRRNLILCAIVAAVVAAHVFLWLSDMPFGQKLFWTLLNTLTWGVILAPAFLIDRWLDAVKARNREEGRGEDG